MEVNAELLGGAAVTVFLALIFFGVVVLWDVALALRSVGDKIDKLEDNIDDDLTDIGHSLDNISNGRGGGSGGTQLHLNGGTISPGPNRGQAQGQPAQAAQSPGTQAASGGPQPSEPRQATRQPRGGSGGAGGVEAATATDPDAGIGPRRADTAAGEPRATGGVDEGAAAARTADGAGVAGGTESATADAEPGADVGPEPTATDAGATGTTPGDGPATAPVETAGDSGTADGDTADDSTADSDTVDGDTATASDDPTDEPDVDTARETETDGDAATDETATDRTHQRAAQNRSRFVTPSDRTAWYAVELDRDAIPDTEPVIAGELTDGSETDGDDAVIAAGPVESAATDETAASTADADELEDDDSIGTADDPVVAAPPAETVEAEPIDRESEAPAADDETADSDSETASIDSVAETDEADDGEAEREVDSADEAETDDEGGDDTAGEALESGADGSTTSRPDAFAFDEAVRSTDSPSDAVAEPTTDDGGDESAAEADAEDAASDRPTAGTGLEPVDEADDGSAETDSDDAGDRSGEIGSGTDETGPESADLDDGSSSEPAVDAADPLADDVIEFDDEELEDVTVEEAVDTINEDAPAPELSSHQFDVSAEVYGVDEDGDGDDADTDGLTRDGGENTVLTYEFDTDTVEISGSTKRLLQYQLRSFADRDATPEADVTIGRDRIVIEIPDSDGDAVQRWSEAAVDIIDRTLYLSDNSSDDS